MSFGRVVDVATPFTGEFQHLVDAVVTDRAELVELGHVEIDRALGDIGKAPVQHHADEAADVGNGRRRPGRRVDRECVERHHVPFEAGLLASGQVEVVHAELTRLGKERIVDVGDVAYALDLVTEVDQAPLQHVIGDEGGGMAQVRGVIGRDAAGVHEHRGAGLERHHRLSGGVIQIHGHGAPIRP